MLNFLPFETLMDEQGRYLVETYQITYAQSLGVLDLIGQREYKPDRKPLLAFGGAVYEEQTYQEEMADNETRFAYIQKQLDLALKRGSSLRAIYTQLGQGNWENLPGTLIEVKAIQDVVAGAELVTGADVNEATVKALSANGELAEYRVLHFATHGAVDSRIPDLSALVLSLLDERTANVTVCDEYASETLAVHKEDGYLRAGEIVNFNLKTDFVNLSACETGLGRLYSGEGVVGLTQAFLLAGANGLSVSLWSVADESTAQFMVALYTLVEEKGLSYAEAITDVKRRFIHGDFGDTLKAPYYWSPFVYYGK
jgi:CHAT domain-containing protein